MNFSPFSCPIFLGHSRARASAPKARGRFFGGHDKYSTVYQKISWEEPNKAESTKLQGAGIREKLCPGKCAAEKGHLPYSFVSKCNQGIDPCCTEGRDGGSDTRYPHQNHDCPPDRQRVARGQAEQQSRQQFRGSYDRRQTN